MNIEYVPNINKIHIRGYALRTYGRILFKLSIRIKKFIKTVNIQKQTNNNKKKI